MTGAPVTGASGFVTAGSSARMRGSWCGARRAIWRANANVTLAEPSGSSAMLSGV
ncbi:hypothetical protein [Streptomyces chryseus]|uniref:hypothetical protein n=1 Tax=Streptomyces chryseus TaxID=68186 RepID=UPI0027E53EF6|nr:hypothetical protein [Streptomyces chryseus]